MSVAIVRDRCRVAVGYSKGGYTFPARALHRLYSQPEALPKTDSNQQVFGCQNLYLVLQISLRANRSFSIETQCREAISEMIGKRGSHIDADD